jgi:hypothetical protein
MISVQIYIKKNSIVETGSATANNSSPFTTIVNSAGGYAVNEFKGHYIKITKGTGIGALSWIVSNTSTNLVLQTGIQIEQYSQYEIYKSEYKRLDLFQDEKISITSSISNANDIGKIYTDYSQSFTIPASDTNNQILSHWYDSAIDGGYDHRQRYDAYIEVDTHRFKNGNFQLEKVNKKNGFIESYTITFYGNLTQLKDKFKDIKLRDLSTGIYAPAFGTDNFWNLFNHTYNSTEVINRVQAFTPFAVYYPLIGSQKQYAYKNGISTQDISLTTAPVIWNELFPAVSMPIVFTLIQYCFNITFTGSFFSLDQWTKLYLYLKNAELLKVQTEISNILFSTKSSGFSEMNLDTETLTTNWNNFGTPSATKYIIPNLIITPASSVPYTVFIYRDGLLFSTFKDLVGTQNLRIDYLLTVGQSNITNYSYTFKIISDSVFSFNTQLNYRTDWRTTGFFTTNYQYAYNTAQSTIANIQIQNYIPDITVNNFITGIIKAFNLIIIPTSENTYEFLPLESYYNEGKTLDITKYVYSDEADIERPKLYKSINFQYENSTNVLNNKYKGLYGTEYGDLIYTNNNSNESSNYDIKLPFENILFEKTVGENFETATIVDKDLKPYIPKPMLIYCNGSQQIDLSNQIRITTETGQTTIGNYNRFSNEYNSLPTDLTLSHLMTMNFNNEQSPWYNIIAPQGLYLRHYSNYINNLYNIKTRILKIKALLPPSLLNSAITDSYGKRLGIELNDRLIVRNKRYIINNYTTDLTTGEASFELITDYRGINAASTVGYRFASLTNVQVDSTAQTFDVIAYKNDYDSFGVKGATNFLSYPISGLQEYSDLLISVSVPVNTSGLDRNDVIGLEYYSNGILQVTEYITVLQTAI